MRRNLILLSDFKSFQWRVLHHHWCALSLPLTVLQAFVYWGLMVSHDLVAFAPAAAADDVSAAPSGTCQFRMRSESCRCGIACAAAKTLRYCRTSRACNSAKLAPHQPIWLPCIAMPYTLSVLADKIVCHACSGMGHCVVFLLSLTAKATTVLCDLMLRANQEQLQHIARGAPITLAHCVRPARAHCLTRCRALSLCMCCALVMQ